MKSMLSAKIKTSAAILGMSQIGSAALRFIRVVIIARVLLPEDFGVAATFWITTGVLMALTELGIEKIIIQDDKGDDSHFGAVAQLLLVLRGFLLSAIILIFAPDIAAFFDASEATDAFRLLALIPLMTGLQHRDVIRMQRTMHFRPLVMSTIVPELLVTMMAYPFAVYFGDFRAFVYLSILAGVARIWMSFWLAERPFLVAWDNAIVLKALRFGWPLMINGLLMLLTLQGEKLIISQFYSKEALGFFAIAFGFATLVPNAVGSVLVQVVLPFLSRIRDNREYLELNLRYFYRVILLMSFAAITVIIFHGELITTIIYSNKYLASVDLIKIITIVFFLRLLRQLPNTLAIVYGNTWMVMTSNLLRQVSLIIALALAMHGVDLELIAASGVLGELLSLAVITGLHKKLHAIPLGLWYRPLGLLAVFVPCLFFVVEQFNERDYFGYYLLASIAAVLVSAHLIWQCLNEQAAVLE